MNNKETYEKIRGLTSERGNVNKKYRIIESVLKDIEQKGFKTLEEVQTFVSDMKEDEQRIDVEIKKIQDSCAHEHTHNVYHDDVECLDCLKTW